MTDMTGADGRPLGDAIAEFTRRRLSAWTAAELRAAGERGVFSPETLEWFYDVAARLDMVKAAAISDVPEFQRRLVFSTGEHGQVLETLPAPVAALNQLHGPKDESITLPATISSDDPGWPELMLRRNGGWTVFGFRNARELSNYGLSEKTQEWYDRIADRMELLGVDTLREVPHHQLNLVVAP